MSLIQSHEDTTLKKFKILMVSKHQSEVSIFIFIISSSLLLKVDNFALTLIKLGVDRIVRFGNLLEIDHHLLPYSLHNQGGINQNIKVLKVTNNSIVITSRLNSSIFRNVIADVILLIQLEGDLRTL